MFQTLIKFLTVQKIFKYSLFEFGIFYIDIVRINTLVLILVFMSNNFLTNKCMNCYKINVYVKKCILRLKTFENPFNYI